MIPGLGAQDECNQSANYPYDDSPVGRAARKLHDPSISAG
jgi:hypothetical protein